jgi:carbon-monoxide dehydrogenase small subunit
MREIKKVPLKFTVNGKIYEREVEPWRTLVELLRDELGIRSPKAWCKEGECGSCTVLVDGEAVNSCIYPAGRIHGKEVTTIESLFDGRTLHPIQEAFVNTSAVQCGFCTTGMILAAKALLDENPRPSDEEIKRGMTGNLCRCNGYVQIREAIKEVAERL